jgi:hypothetical protein
VRSLRFECSICKRVAGGAQRTLMSDVGGEHLPGPRPGGQVRKVLRLSQPLSRFDLGPVRVICEDQRSVPETHVAISQLAIRKLEHDAAYVGIGEEVVSRE